MADLKMESVFSNVTIEKTLKNGERGSIHIVRDKESRARYIYREFMGSSEVYCKLKEIDCPHLPKVYEIEEQEGMVFVLEEYIEGDTLAFLLEGGPLPESDAKSILLQICKALEILHGYGAVHRDIKPENIIIRGREAVLIDFDVSRIIKPESTTDTQIMGTTGYAAPEQYGFSQTDARADIYSLGVLLNEMLTRQHPSKYLATGTLRPIVERCIKVNVDERYKTVAQLYAAIASASRKTKRKFPAYAAVLLLIVGFAGIFLLGRVQNGSVPQEETIVAEAETETAATEAVVVAAAVDVFVRQPVEISTEQWQGSAGAYMTPFYYDLDGDGEKESYTFGIYQADIPEGYRHSLEDHFSVREGETYQRRAYPCVWKYGENDTLEMAEDFAPLLTNGEVRVWRLSDKEVPSPEAYTSDGLWQGGVQVLYTPENEGIWIYEVTAYLGNQPLTAIAKSYVGLLSEE